MQRRFISGIAVAGLFLTACGGGSDDNAGDSLAPAESATTEVTEPAATESVSTEPAATVAAEGSDESVAPVTDVVADASTDTVADAGEGDAPTGGGLIEDLPQFLSDFDRVCTTETGFGAATPYAADQPGPHPFVMMEESDSGYIFDKNIDDAPAGWNIRTDVDFDDNSEIVPTELIGCSMRGAMTPTGIMCDLDVDDGSTVTLEIVDVTYELTVREATTGNAVGTATIEASDPDCPYYVYLEEGDTQYFNSPDSVQYINAMKPFVTP